MECIQPDGTERKTAFSNIKIAKIHAKKLKELGFKKVRVFEILRKRVM